MEEGDKEVSYRMSQDNSWMGLFVDGHVVFAFPIKQFEMFVKATDLAWERAGEELEKEDKDAISTLEAYLEEQKCKTTP